MQNLTYVVDVCILWDMKTRGKIKNVNLTAVFFDAELGLQQFAMNDFQALKACFVPDGSECMV
eukprot:767994-Hanusia_phi.AAC.3